MSIPARLIRDLPIFDAFRQVGVTPNEVWHTPGTIGEGSPAATVPEDQIYAVPFLVCQAITIDRIGFMKNANGAGALGRCGIYRGTSRTILYPSALVIDGGQQDLSAGGAAVHASTISVALTPDLYWLVYLGDAATHPQLICHDTSPCSLPPLLGVSSTVFGTFRTHLRGAFAYAALPATFPAGATPNFSNNMPVIAVRIASSP
jgi:hypothetical protein